MMLVLFKCWWSAVLEIMCSYIEAHITRYSTCVLNKTGLCSVHSHRDILIIFLWLNIHRQYSICFNLGVRTYFWCIHPKFGKFHDILHYTVNSVFMTWVCDYVCVFRIAKSLGSRDETSSEEKTWIKTHWFLFSMQVVQGKVKPHGVWFCFEFVFVIYSVGVTHYQ